VSAAIEEKVMPIDADRYQSGVIRSHGREPITEASHHNYGVLSLATSSSIQQRQRDQDRVARRHDRLSRFMSLFDRPPGVPDFPGESPGIVWSASLTQSALASVSMGTRSV
jgi:hypothetical protein